MWKATLSLLLLSAALPAQEAEIRKAESAWAAAVQGRDFAALEAMYADELIYAHSSGVVESKRQYMDRIRQGLQRYDDVKHESVRVVLHGDTAIAHCFLRMRGKSNERSFDDHLMMMHVWVKRAGAWKLAAHQTTKLAD
ncbi:MAG: nuclear transport factor 2 family protein [Candidatus Solibacter usitatus]|nr:nuclear transport factor 2 family protein [Candidatus Solibacter usitatus]